MQVLGRVQRKRRGRVAHVEDGHTTKKNPASLCETLKAVDRLWDIDRNVVKYQDQVVFAEKLSPILKDVFERYRGLGRPPTDIPKYLRKIENGTTPIAYFQLRAYADYLGIPTGLLLLYSHIVGNVRRESLQIEVKNFIDAIQIALGALSEGISQRGLEGDWRELFIDRDDLSNRKRGKSSEPGNADKPNAYLAEIFGLEILIREYERSGLDGAGLKRTY